MYTTYEETILTAADLPGYGVIIFRHYMHNQEPLNGLSASSKHLDRGNDVHKLELSKGIRCVLIERIM